MHDLNQQGQIPAPPAMPAVSPPAPPAGKPPILPIVFGFVAFMGVGWSINNAWLGIATGLAVIASAVVAHQRGRRALIALVWKNQPGILWTLATAALGALYISLGINKLGADRKQAAETEGRARAAQIAQKAHLAEQQRLTAELPRAVNEFREQLAEAARRAEASGANDGLSRVKLIKDAISALAARFDGQVPLQLRAVEQDTDEQVAALTARVQLQQTYESIDSQIASAKDAIGHSNWLAADNDYTAALRAVDAVEKSRATLAAYIPPAFDATRRRAEINSLRSRIAGQVAIAKKKLAAEEDKRIREAAYTAVCGPKPGLQPGEDAWVLFKMKLEKVANDPDSIEIVDCTLPVMTEKHCWVTRCNIRGKNAFGHLVLQQKWVGFSKLGVEEVPPPAE